MNILILAPKVPYPPIDGGAIATLSLAKSLKNAGNKVTFLAINTSKHKVNIEDIPKELVKELNIKIVEINTKVNLFKAVFNLLFSKLPYNGIRFYNDNYTKVLIKLLKKDNFDLIQLEGLYMSLYLDKIRKNSKAPVVMRAHNVEHIIWKRNYMFESNFIKKKYYKILSKRVLLLEKYITNKLDACVPISQHDYKVFRSLGIKIPMQVAVAGINTEHVNDNLRKINYSNVFFIGALDWIPNQEGLKWFVDKVWPKIYDKYPGKNFHIAGRNAPKWIIKNVKKPGVIYHGEIESARDYMEEYGIMVVPLFAGSGMRIKILEGMAAGITIITTSIGLEGINAKNGEEVLLADDENNFIEKICFVFENHDICRNIGQNATEFIRNNYNNLSIAQELTGFYKSIIK